MAYETYDTGKINNIKFTQGFRGYDATEVDEFLDEIVKEIEKLNSHIKNLKEDLAREKRKNTINEQEIQRLEKINSEMSAAPPVAEIKEEPKEEIVPEPVPAPVVEKPKEEDNLDEMKNLIAETLLSAKKSAERVVRDAENKAEEIIEDAERRARERVVSLKAEIVESEQKLGAMHDTVKSAKEKYIKAFQTQIAEINKIAVGNEEIPTTFFAPQSDEVTLEELQEAQKEEPVVEEPVIAEIPVEETAPEPMPEPEPVVEAEEPKQVPKYEGVSIFDKLPKPPSAENFSRPQPESKPAQQPSKHSKDEVVASTETFENPTNNNAFNRIAVNPYDDDYTSQDDAQYDPEQQNTGVDKDDNQQYIELALSKYNDNKYHNKKYPDTGRDITINTDDDDQGIFQPEDRSILSSVIEDILNNKKNND